MTETARLKRNTPFVGSLALVLGFAALVAVPGLAQADKIKHPAAVFAGLDKITGRIISFEVAIGETVQFGSLQITPRICYTRPPTEAPQTTSFVEVEEVVDEKKFKKVFAGWMFASSPGLHGVEHPVYDAWLTDCKGGKDIIRAAKPAEEEADLPDKAEPARPVKSRAQQRREARKARQEQQPQRRAPTQQFFPQAPRRGGVNPFGNY